MDPSERDLLRDIPYLLLGLPSTHFPLQEKSLSLPQSLPAPVISLLYSLAEPGLLYKSLQAFVATEETLGEDTVGLVGQSLRGAVKGELAGWMNLVAGIEGEIRRFLAEEGEGGAIGTGGVTLKRVAIWVREGTLGLRLMSVIIEDTNGTFLSLLTIINFIFIIPFISLMPSSLHPILLLLSEPSPLLFVTNLSLPSQFPRLTSISPLRFYLKSPLIPGLKGGQLVDKVHSFTAHGDPYIRTFAHKLLLQITKPWYEMLKTWIYQGVLQDPFQEFFVRDTEPIDSRSRNPYTSAAAGYASGGYPSATAGPKTSAWEGKYSLDESLVPGFIGEQVARKVFLIGKSLNFIRGDCAEEGYVIEHAKEADVEGN